MSRISFAVSLVAAFAVTMAAPAATVAADSNDLGYDAGLQWGLDVIGAEASWSVGRGAGVTIAVVDSGVQRDHLDLRDKLVDGIACLGTGGDPSRCAGVPDDDNGHGTHVAGIAAASTGNGIGVAGAAPDARLMPVRVLREQCTADGCRVAGNEADVIAGVRWAVTNGAQIVNLSLGSATDSVLGPEFGAAVRDAWDAGVITVIASGNDYVMQPEFASLPAVVVAATTRDDGSPTYSNGVGSAKWALSAPGGDDGDEPDDCALGGTPRGVLSTYQDDNSNDVYACLAGTSMAAPHVSGALAILLSTGMTPEASIQRLIDTAVDLGEPGRDETFGHGRLDIAAATGAQVGGATTTARPGSSTIPTAEAGSGPDPATPDASTAIVTTTTSIPRADQSGTDGDAGTPGRVVPPPVSDAVVFESASGLLPASDTSPESKVPAAVVAALLIVTTASATTVAHRRQLA